MIIYCIGITCYDLLYVALGFNEMFKQKYYTQPVMWTYYHPLCGTIHIKLLFHGLADDRIPYKAHHQSSMTPEIFMSVVGYIY